MKLIFTIFFICSSFLSFSQFGKVKFNITITDTIKPYFLDIFIKKGDSVVTKKTVIRNGSYFINDLKEGDYNFEFSSFNAGSRRLNIDKVTIIKDSVINVTVFFPPSCKYYYPKHYKPICPYKHTDSIVRILYGYPTGKTMDNAKKGLVYLGGCEITGCDPKYYCTLHSVKF